jgi:hypothetical protein
MAKKIRTHNEYFREIVSEKYCRYCDRKTQVYSSGEYFNVRWKTVLHFCEHCYEKRVKGPLIDHAEPCGCKVVLNWKGFIPKPEWLTLD